MCCDRCFYIRKDVCEDMLSHMDLVLYEILSVWVGKALALSYA